MTSKMCISLDTALEGKNYSNTFKTKQEINKKQKLDIRNNKMARNQIINYNTQTNNKKLKTLKALLCHNG